MAKRPLLRKSEPGTFEHLLRPVEVSARSMVRLSRRPQTEPWFGRSASGRFDDPFGRFGVCYAAADESVIELERSIDLSPNFALGHYNLSFVHSSNLNGVFRPAHGGSIVGFSLFF